MKIGKKISLFALLMLVGINVVRADSSCDLVFQANDSNYFNELNSSINGIRSSIYMFTQNSKRYKAYCMNPGWTSGKRNGEDAYYSCKRVVLDATSDSENQKRHDIGLAKILKDTSVSDGDRVLAVRIYEMYWKTFNKNGGNSSADYSGHKAVANRWLDDANVKKALDALREKLPKGYIVDRKFSGAGAAGMSGINETKAKNLLIAGLNAATAYNPDIDTSITYDNPQKTREIIAEDADGSKTYLQKETYTLDVKYFTKDKGKITLDFSCPDCTKKGITTKFFINDTEYTAANLKNANLLALPGSSNTLVADKDNYLTGKIKFRIEFTGKVSNCEEIPYKITIHYSDPKVEDRDIYEVKASNYYNTSGVQTFYVIGEATTAATATIDTKLKFCTGGTPSSENCSASLTELHCNQCDSNDNTLQIKEGYIDANPNDCTQGSNLNIKECIAHDGAEDKVGNSYESAELDGDVYCGLYCKEDYTITLPGTQIVKSGRYFTLSADISGTKTCYANDHNGGPIGGEGQSGFLSDINSAACNSVKAYNEFALAKALTEATDFKPVYYAEDPESPDNWCTPPEKKTRPSCVSKPTKNCQTVNGKQKCEYESECHDEEYWDYTNAVIKIKSIAVTSAPYTTFTCSGQAARGIITTKPVDLEKKYCRGDEDAAIAEVKETLIEEKGEPGTFNGVPGGGDLKAMGSLGEYVGGTGAAGKLGTYGIYGFAYNLNVCSNAETMDFNQTVIQLDWPNYAFDPELGFWYQEDAYMSIAKNKSLTMSKIDVDEDSYDMLYCVGSVSNDYENCSTGWTTSVPWGTANVFVCAGGNETDCHWMSVDYSKASYVKKVMNQKATFITPTQFYTIYPSGQIVVKANEEDEIENSSALENGLPVGLGTKAGAYSYVLMFSKLGEHYNTGKLGRLWGDQVSVVSKTLQQENSCRQNSALKYSEEIDGTVLDGGVYSCQYDVNICGCSHPDDDTYYCQDGEPCSPEEYEKDCPDPCPDCPVVCDGNICGYNPDGTEICCRPDDPVCPTCPVECPTCLYNNGSNIDYRPITPENMNPNDRELGSNWDFDENINTALELKAYVTTHEIESDGAKIYDTNGETPKVTFKVNSSMVNEIRKYNDEHEKEGYYNNSLECYDYVDADGTVYKNIYCYSTFIDLLVEKFPDQITGFENRVMGDKATRRAKTQSSGYWTTWAEARDDAHNWNVTTEEGIESYFTNFRNIGVGPSWK